MHSPIKINKLKNKKKILFPPKKYMYLINY